jgi:hypothetical protein
MNLLLLQRLPVLIPYSHGFPQLQPSLALHLQFIPLQLKQLIPNIVAVSVLLPLTQHVMMLASHKLFVTLVPVAHVQSQSLVLVIMLAPVLSTLPMINALTLPNMTLILSFRRLQVHVRLAKLTNLVQSIINTIVALKDSLHFDHVPKLGLQILSVTLMLIPFVLLLLQKCYAI